MCKSRIEAGYELALFKDRYRGMDTLYHDGGGMGMNSQMLKFPAAGLDIAIIVNCHDLNARSLADKILPIEPDSDGAFRLAGGSRFMKRGMILVGDPARPTAIQFSYFGMLDDRVWVPPVQTPDVRAIEGHYRSEPTGTQLTILDDEGGPWLNPIDRFGSVKFPLECLGQDSRRAKSTIPALAGYNAIL